MIDICLCSCKPRIELQGLIDEIDKTTYDYNLIIVANDRRISINRNECYKHLTSSIVVFIDDDVTGFEKGWVKYLTTVLDMPYCKGVSARLYNQDGSTGSMINFGHSMLKEGIIESPDKAFPFSCCAFKKQTIEAVYNCIDLPDDKPFDEEFTSWEDTSFCYAVRYIFRDAKFYINNNLKIIHKNEKKWEKINPNSFVNSRRRFRLKWVNKLI